jgi:hypothetical protein
VSVFDPFSDADDLPSAVPRLRLSLRITGDMLDPDFLTQQLGVAPTLSAVKGDATRRGGGVHETGVWVYKLAVPPDTELDEVLGLLLDPFPDDSVLWEELTSTYSVDVFCGVFMEADNQRTVVSADVLARLGRLGLPLHFDFYAPFLTGGGSEEDERG